MDGNTSSGGVEPPTPPSQQPLPPPPSSEAQFQVARRPTIASANADAPPPVADRTGGGSSRLFKIFLGLAALSVASVVIVVAGLVIATRAGVFDQDQIATDSVPTIDRPEVALEEDDSEQRPDLSPITPDGVTIVWDGSPSSCDGNDKRLFSAEVRNTTPKELELRMRILDSGNNFVHQSHVYTVPAADAAPVDLGGIPAGESIVQIVDEVNDEAIGQTKITFEGC